MPRLSLRLKRFLTYDLTLALKTVLMLVVKPALNIVLNLVLTLHVTGDLSVQFRPKLASELKGGMTPWFSFESAFFAPPDVSWAEISRG